MNTFTKSACLLLLALFVPQPALAECMACTSSHGVKIEMHDGSTVDGYIQWNPFFFDEYISPSRVHPSVEGFVSAKGWPLNRLEEDKQTFERWLELVNHVLQEKKAADSPTKQLTVYGELPQIKFPFPNYVGVEGKVKTVSMVEARAISRNAALPLKVDMTGIDVLPLADVEKLTNVPPRYTVGTEGSTGGAYYVVYGEKISLTDLLNHITFHSSGYGTDILVNQVRIIGGHSGAAPAVDLISKENKTSDDEESIRFIKRLEQFQAELKGIKEPCRAEVRKIMEGGEKFSPQDPKRQELKTKANVILKECTASERSLNSRYWRSLGTEKELREKGVLQFTSAWD